MKISKSNQGQKGLKRETAQQSKPLIDDDIVMHQLMSDQNLADKLHHGGGVSTSSQLEQDGALSQAVQDLYGGQSAAAECEIDANLAYRHIDYASHFTKVDRMKVAKTVGHDRRASAVLLGRKECAAR